MTVSSQRLLLQLSCPCEAYHAHSVFVMVDIKQNNAR